MNEDSFGGWLDADEHLKLILDSTDKFSESILSDRALNDFERDASFDAGFAYGVEAQKHGLGEA